MSQIGTVSVPLSVQSRPLVSASTEAMSIPRAVWFMVAGITLTAIAGTWDFAWHFSIGRETQFTPPHLTAQMGGILVGIACAYTILATTSAGATPARDTSVKFLGFYAPGGVFIALWGAVTLASSFVFDNWWHNAYGLDVALMTPPHLLVFFGSYAAKIGTLAWIASILNRSVDSSRRHAAWLFLLVAAVGVWQSAYMIMINTWTYKLHSAACYLAVATVLPTWLIGGARGSAHKWGCTILAGFYTAIGLTQEWVLPLIPAQPKLGPVYQHITHLIPVRFPLLLIVPAFVTDLLLQKLKGRSSWFKAICIGPAFLLSFLTVQWPFADFLMSPAARNWVFGTAYFPYFDTAGFLYDPYKFAVIEKTRGEFLITMALAFLVCTLTVLLGLVWGNWMRRIRR
jgi:hypothetical protein